METKFRKNLSAQLEILGAHDTDKRCFKKDHSNSHNG